MIKKGDKDKVNKLDELCYRIYLRDDFQQELTALRIEFDIPEEGFTDNVEREKWEVSLTTQQQRGVQKKISALTKKYALPPNSNLLIQEYLCSGLFGPRIVERDNFEPCDFALDKSQEAKLHKQWQESGVPYVNLFVSDYASKKEVHEYIDTHWNVIQIVLDMQRAGPKKRIRSTIKTRERNEQIMDLQKRSSTEIEDSTLTKQYKIARKITEKTNQKVTWENVRKIIERRTRKQN